ncbi:MAG TPA: ABC transporter ATP-binding protein [Actinomycetes bacterium]
MSTVTTAPALEAERLGKRYGRRVWALRDCTLQLPQGRVTALVGPNGAGKTTLLQLAIGLMAPTGGTVRVFGEHARANTPQALARVGFVAQDHPLYKGFTVADLLTMGQRLNLPGRFDRPLAERRLAQLDIPLDRRAGRLSNGQQAQVALAMALAKRPRLLLLDEPVASLDPLARREFMQVLMGATAEDGLTVLLSSHVVAELERVCDHLVVLVAGRVRVAGDVEELLASHRLLVGPRADQQALRQVPGVLSVRHGDRQTSLLVRTSPDRPATHPNWQAHPVNLEDLVLAYLQLPQPSLPQPSHDPASMEVTA